jgi:hypothetical protein
LCEQQGVRTPVDAAVAGSRLNVKYLYPLDMRWKI